MSLQRDFVGYGMNPPVVRWPNGARVAVQVAVNYVNDARAFRGGGGGPDDFYSIMRHTFDMLYEEGATRPKMMTVGLHCRVAGRPALARVVDMFFRYARQFPDVLFARRVDIARWWLRQGIGT